MYSQSCLDCRWWAHFKHAEIPTNGKRSCINPTSSWYRHEKWGYEGVGCSAYEELASDA